MSLEKFLEKVKKHNPVLSPKQVRVRSLVFFLLAGVSGYLCYLILSSTGDLYYVLVAVPAVLFYFGVYALITGKLPKP